MRYIAVHMDYSLYMHVQSQKILHHLLTTSILPALSTSGPEPKT